VAINLTYYYQRGECMLSKFSVRRPVTVIMVTLIFIIFGIVSFTNLSTDLFPSIDLPIGAVSITYIGASPEEIENLVSAPVEATLQTVENIKSIRSISSEFNALLILEFNDGTNIDLAMLEVREKLDLIEGSLPSGISAPMVIKFNPSMMPIMNFSLSQEGVETADLTTFIEKTVKPRIERLEGVASVSVSGGSSKEIEVLIDSEKLEILGLEVSMISNILKAQNFNFPIGTLEENGKDYTLRASSEFKSIDEIKELILFSVPLVSLADGTELDSWEVLTLQRSVGAMMTTGNVDMATLNPKEIAVLMVLSDLSNATMEILRLDDLAEINFVEKNTNVYSKVNGENAISISIQKQADANTTTVVERVHGEIDKIVRDFPNTEIVVVLDQGKYISQMVDSVSLNAVIGAVLAVFVLFIFLKDLRPTIVIGLAIPISVIVAFSAIYFTGITLNIVSMGGLALGIGMLVDNAVVVLENIYRLRKLGLSKTEAAIQGSQQVTGAIVASTLTTIAVFMPVVFVQGFTAQIFKEMALTVSITLIASLLVALTLVPMLSSKLIKKPDSSTHHRFMDATNQLYSRLLKGSLKYKWVVVVITLIAFSISIFGITQVGTELMPQTDEGQISIAIAMPRGSLYRDTVTEVVKIENYLLQLDGVQTVSTSVGGGAGLMSFFGGGVDSGSINVLLAGSSDRTVSTQQMADKIRDEATAMTQAEVTVEAVSSNNMTMGGASGIAFTVTGDDFEELERLATEVAAIMTQTPGAVDIDSGISKGSPELSIVLNEEIALPKGLTTAQIAGTISSLLSNEKATSITVDGQLIDVVLNESSKKTLTLDEINQLEFTTLQGENVKLSEIAAIEEGTGYTSINRIDQKRTLTVSAKLAEGYDLGTVNGAIEKEIDMLNIKEGYQVSSSGEAEQMAESFRSLALALALGALLVYMIMASQFESLIYPFVIVLSVPLAYSGAFIALFITNTPLSIVGFLGLIVLTGIVVNNGIVLIDYINQLKADGHATKEAILLAGPTRLRPILMTALTTILALLPIALGLGEGAEMITPLGLTVTGGLVFSTVLTLIIVPVVYDIFDVIKQKFQRHIKEEAV
jgi:multidrug efflux pump subunit AcrB